MLCEYHDKKVDAAKGARAKSSSEDVRRKKTALCWRADRMPTGIDERCSAVAPGRVVW